MNERRDEKETDDSNNSTLQQSFSPIDRSLFLDQNLLTCHLTCAMIGIPANLFVMGLIMGSKRLRNPRTFVWLGVGFANILLLCNQLIEFVSVCWPSPETIKMADWILGMPHLNLFASSLINVVERHLCLRFPKWHRENVTNNGILFIHVGSLIVQVFIVKGRQFYGDLCVTCVTLSGFDFTVNSCVAGFVACLAIQFVLSATFSRTYPPSHGLRHPPVSSLTINNSPFVQIEDERVSRLNMKAAHAAMMGGLALLVFAAPPMIFAAFGLGSCLSSTGPTGCIERFQIFVYCVEFAPIYCSVVSPVLFVSLSRDILSMLRDRLGLLDADPE